jgi:hypothetical protein
MTWAKPSMTSPDSERSEVDLRVDDRLPKTFFQESTNVVPVKPVLLVDPEATRVGLRTAERRRRREPSGP